MNIGIVVILVSTYVGSIIISEVKCSSLISKIKKNLQKQNFSIKKNINFEIKNSICSTLELFILGFNLHKINNFIKDYDKNYERCKIKLLQDKKIEHKVTYINTNIQGYGNNRQDFNRAKTHSTNTKEKIRNEKIADLIQQREKLIQSLENNVISTYNGEQDSNNRNR